MRTFRCSLISLIRLVIKKNNYQMNYFTIFWTILTTKLKKKFLFILLLFLILSLLETLSVGMIFPFINLLLDKNEFLKILDNYNLILIKDFIKDQSIDFIVLISLFLILFIFLFKHIFSLFSYHFIYNFCKLINQFLSKFFLQNYISKRFQDYTESNLSSKLNNMLTGVEIITNSFLYNAIIIVGEFLIIIFFFLF